MTVSYTGAAYLASPVEYIKALRSRNDPPSPGWPSKTEIALQGWVDSNLQFVHKAEVVRDFVVEAWLRGEPEILTNGQLHAVFAQVSQHCDTRRCLPTERLAAFENAFASADYGEVGEITLAAAADNVASVFGGQNDECNVGIDAWMNMWRGYLSLMKSSTTPVGGLSRFIRTCGTILFDMLVTVTTSVTDHAVTLKAVASINEHASAIQHAILSAALESDMIGRLYLSEATLCAQNPLGAHVAALRREAGPSNICSRYALCLQLYRQTILDIQQRKFYLFVQPSSSRLPFESSVNASADSRILATTQTVLSFFDDTSSLCPPSQHWNYRGQLWGIVAVLGCYVETSMEWQSALRNDSCAIQDLLKGIMPAQTLLDAPHASGPPLLDALARIAAIDYTTGQIRSQALAYSLCAKGCLQSDQLLGVHLHFSALTHSLPNFVETIMQALDEALPDGLESLASQQDALFAECTALGESFERAVAALAPNVIEPSRYSSQLKPLIAVFQQTFAQWIMSEPQAGSKRKRVNFEVSDTVALKLVVLSYIERAFLTLELDGTPKPLLASDITEHLQTRMRSLYEYFNRWSSPAISHKDLGRASSNRGHQIAAAAGLRLLRPATPLYDSSLLHSATEHLIKIMSDETTMYSLRAALFDHLAAACSVKGGMDKAHARDFLEETLRLLMSEQCHVGFSALVWGRLADGLVLRIESSSESSDIELWSETIFKALCQAQGTSPKISDVEHVFVRCLRSTLTWECEHLRDSLRNRALRALTTGENLLAGLTCLNMFPADSGLVQDDDVLKMALLQLCEHGQGSSQDWRWVSWLSQQPRGRLFRLPSSIHSGLVEVLLKLSDVHLEGAVRSAAGKAFAVCFSRLSMPDSLGVYEHTVARLLSHGHANCLHTRLIACSALLMHLLEQDTRSRLPQSLTQSLIDCVYDTIDGKGAACKTVQTFDVDRLEALGIVRRFRDRFMKDHQDPGRSNREAIDMARLVRISDRMVADLSATSWSSGSELSSSTKIHVAAADLALKTFSLADQKQAITACMESRCHVRGCLLLLTAMLRRSGDEAPFVLTTLSVLCNDLSTAIIQKAGVLHVIQQLVLNKVISRIQNQWRDRLIEQEVKLAAADIQTILSILVRFMTTDAEDILPITLAILRAFVNHRQPSLASISSEFLLLAKLALQALHTRFRDNSDVATDIARFLSDSFGRHHGRKAPIALSRLAPALLVEWVRLEARRPLHVETSRCLRPGLLALCKRTAEVDRTNDSDGSGAPFGMGDVLGQVERDVWAKLWHGWTKTRYSGQG